MSALIKGVTFLLLVAQCLGVRLTETKPELRSEEVVVTWHPKQKDGFHSIHKNREQHFENELSFFEIGDFVAFSGQLTDEELNRVKGMDGVVAVQHSLKYTPSQSGAGQSGSEANPGWGLDRLDQVNLPLNNEYDWQSDGTGVDAYILDSGVNTDLSIWNPGQAKFGADCFRTVCSTTTGQGDNINHGTPIAAIVGSQKFGVAKGATIWGVKVFDITAPATTQFIINGIDFVAQHDNGGRPKVIVLTLAVYEIDDALNNAVIAAKAAGVTIVMAAGNGSDTPEPDDACEQSPQISGATIVVAGSAIDDTSASFTNFGKCVNIYGPSQDVNTFTNTGAATTVSGTSYGAAFVGGAAVLVRGENPNLTPDQVQEVLISSANGVIKNVPTSDTPNLLVYTTGAVDSAASVVSIPRSTGEILRAVFVVLAILAIVTLGGVFLARSLRSKNAEEKEEGMYYEMDMEVDGGIEYVNEYVR